MHCLIAAIQGQTLVTTVIGLIILGVIVGLLKWLVDYCQVPEPIRKVIMVIGAIIVVMILCNFLLSLIGREFIVW